MESIMEKYSLLCRKYREIEEESGEKAIHDKRVRIEFKKFRYTLENLAMLEKPYEERLESLKRYQDLLGDIQDGEVYLNGIRKFYGKEKDKAKYIKMLQRKKESNIEQFIEEKSKFIEVCQEAIN